VVARSIIAPNIGDCGRGSDSNDGEQADKDTTWHATKRDERVLGHCATTKVMQ